MTAKITSHERKLDEHITVRGEHFTAVLDKRDNFHDVLGGDYHELDKSVKLTWVLKGYTIEFERGATIHNEQWCNIYCQRDGDKKVIFPELAKLKEYLTADEKAAMVEAALEVGEWSKDNPTAWDIGSMAWEVCALYAKAAEK